MKPSEILAKAADLITPEGAWTQEYSARTAHGYPIGPREAAAACFCVVGAITRVSGDMPSNETLEFLRAATCSDGVTSWNDALARTQTEVVAAFRKASELAREAGQ